MRRVPGRPYRPLLALTTLALALGAVWLASVQIIRSAQAPISARERKYAGTERGAFFRLEPGQVLRFSVPADADRLALSTHLVLDPTTPFEPERRYTYGVGMRVTDLGGGVVVDRPLFARTRESRSHRTEGLWLVESAFTADPEVRLADGRHFAVSLPPRTQDTELELRYTGTSGALLLRVYGRSFTSAATPAPYRRTWTERAQRRAERTTAVPWEKLSHQRQEHLIAQRWQALAPRGSEGVDFGVEMVHRTDFRLPFIDDEDAAEETLWRTGALAFNVQGPATLKLRLWLNSDDPANDALVSVRRTDAQGRVQQEQFAVPDPHESLTHAVEIPPGVHSLEVSNPVGAALRFRLDGPLSAWVAPRELAGEVPDGDVALRPDFRRFEAWATGGACEPIELELGDAGDDRILRLDVQRLGLLQGKATASVRVSMENASGTVLVEDALEVPEQPAPLEVAHAGLLPEGVVPCGSTIDASAPEAVWVDRPFVVSERRSVRLMVPRGATRLKLHASAPVAASLFSYTPGPPAVPLPPYGRVAPTDARWRNAPLDMHHWDPLRPWNHQTLVAQGARLTLLRQVHLQTTRSGPGTRPLGPAVTVLPLDPPASRELLEPVDPKDLQAVATASTLLRPGAPIRVHFDERATTRPELRLLANPADLGSSVEILVDGRAVEASELRATHVRSLLPPVAPGTRELLVRSSSGGLSALLNRPPASGEDAVPVKVRTVFRLDGEEGVRVPVDKPGRGPVTLNVIVYGPPEATGRPLKVTIDGGTPRRRRGAFFTRVTGAVREVKLPTPDRPEATTPSGEERWHGRAFAVELGDDLAAGRHVIQVRAPGGEPLWARFFVYRGPERIEPSRQWIRPGWDPEEDEP